MTCLYAQNLMHRLALPSWNNKNKQKYPSKMSQSTNLECVFTVFLKIILLCWRVASVADVSMAHCQQAGWKRDAGDPSVQL